MSFTVVCDGCGAPSGPSVGICPFCKSVMVDKKSKDSPTLTRIRELYNEGDLASALAMFVQTERAKPKLMDNPNFLLIGIKILLETEGPESKIRHLINHGLMLDPSHQEINDYLEILNGKTLMTDKLNDEGEQQVLNVLRRSPRNYHALFIVGAHQFWVDGVESSAIRLLERCVSVRPQFLRAWGCLGAIYEKLGQTHPAARAYKQCVKLESDPSMSDFFKQKIGALS